MARISDEESWRIKSHVKVEDLCLGYGITPRPPRQSRASAREPAENQASYK